MLLYDSLRDNLENDQRQSFYFAFISSVLKFSTNRSSLDSIQAACILIFATLFLQI